MISQKRQHFVRTGVDTLWMWICFLLIQGFSQKHHPLPYKMPNAPSWCPHSMASDQGHHFPAEECSGEPCAWHFLIFPYSFLSWSCWLDTMVEWPFENLVTVPARWQCLPGLLNVLQEAMHVYNQHTIYGAVSPTLRIHQSKNQGVELGVHYSLLPPVIHHQENFCFPPL